MKKFHLSLAQDYWKTVVKPGDTVIDATAGNGHDCLFLAKLLQGNGLLAVYDIQKKALDNTKERLREYANQENFLRFHLSSHETFFEKSAALIVYNLGYLPGGDKSLTTKVSSTLASLNHALQIVTKGISITCYPGHAEGLEEEKKILEWIKELPSASWEVRYHQWINKSFSPSLIWIRPLSSQKMYL